MESASKELGISPRHLLRWVHAAGLEPATIHRKSTVGGPPLRYIFSVVQLNQIRERMKRPIE